MTKTERAIERVREWCVQPADDCFYTDIQYGPLRLLLAEHDRLKAELDKLTASTDAGNTLEFVPLPTSRPPEEGK